MPDVYPDDITITALNMRSLNSGKVYLTELMDKSAIVLIVEHRLYSNKLYKLNDLNQHYDVSAKASGDLELAHQNVKAGHCGLCDVLEERFK